MITDRLRCGLYLRISKDDAQTGLAVERQRDRCLEVIEREGLEVFDTYSDNGVSAYARNVKRPEFDRMTRDYAAGKFDVVVCWDLDRFSRQPIQLEQWIDMGAERGLKFITPTEITDLGTDNGRLFARMKASIARAEVERKSARQKAQARQAKEKGTFKTRVGFDDPVIIERIFKAIIEAKEGTSGVYAIAQSLNAELSLFAKKKRDKEGKVTSTVYSPWSGQGVRRVAMTPRHRGTIISETVFDDVQVLIHQGVKVGPKFKGLYSGVARCSTCTAAMTASGDRYVCSFATNHPGSKGHQTVIRTTLETEIDKAMVAAFTFGRETMEQRTEDVTALDVELARVTEARLRVVGLVAEDLISTLDAAPQLRDLNSKRERLEERRSATITNNAHAQMLDGIISALSIPGRVSFDDVADMKRKLAARWDGLEAVKRRTLAREFLSVTVQPRTERGRVHIVHRVVTSLNEDTEAP